MVERRPVLDSSVGGRPSPPFVLSSLLPSNTNGFHVEYDFDVYPTSTGGQVKVETATMSDIETALRAQLSDANEAITLLKSMVANQMGDALVPAEGEVVEKGKAKDEEERDDDSHYFESYAYNGQSERSCVGECGLMDLGE